MAKTSSRNGLPAWVLPVVIAAGVVILAFVGWKAFSGGSHGATGQAVEVKPGMYDFRQEALKGNVGSHHEASPPNGSR